MVIKSFFRQANDALKFFDVIFNGGDTVMSIPADLGVLAAQQPFSDDQAAMGNRTTHIFDRGSKR